MQSNPNQQEIVDLLPENNLGSNILPSILKS